MDRTDGEPRPSLPAILLTYRVPILLGSVSVFLLIIALVLLVKSAQTTKPIEFISASDARVTDASVAAIQAGRVAVDVAGAIVHPGLYWVSFDARIDDVLTRAGGLAPDADGAWVSKMINRAKRVSDGMKIYIPSKNDDVAQSETSHNSGTVVTTSPGQSSNAVVSVNTGSQSQLESLSGIGPVTAQKIISNRPYGDLQELVSKKVISQSLFTKLTGQISL